MKLNIKSNIISDDRFKNVTKLKCDSLTITLELEEFPRLKKFYCKNSIVYGKSKFPLLEKFKIFNFDYDYEDILSYVIDLNNFLLVDSEMPVIKDISIVGIYADESISKKVLKCNNFFRNLEKLEIHDTNIETLDFKVHYINPIIKDLILHNKIKEVSGSLCNKFPEDVKGNYKLIPPMRKSANNIF